MKMEQKPPVRIVLVDDHTLLRHSLAEMLAMEECIEVVGEAEDGSDGVQLVRAEKPDVVLLDVEMPTMGAADAMDEIFAASPLSKVVILSMHDEPHLVRELLALGASAYVVKSATREELVAAIRATARGEGRVLLSLSQNAMRKLESSEQQILSKRQLETLLLAARGKSNDQIARVLHLSRGTVKRHLSNIYAKLEVSSRSEATQKALSKGWITSRDVTEPGVEDR